MEVTRYYSLPNPPLIRSMPCAPCAHIVLQVFFSDFEDGILINDEASYLEFDFADNEYGKFKTDLKAIAAEKETYCEYLDEFYSATPIEMRNLPEIEKELINLVPVEPAIYKGYTVAYEDCKKGHEHFHQQEYEQAIGYYRAAAMQQWNDHIAFCLSLAYYLKGDYANAATTASRYQGSVYEVATLGSWRYGMNAFVLDTSPIEQLDYLLERRMVS